MHDGHIVSNDELQFGRCQFDFFEINAADFFRRQLHELRTYSFDRDKRHLMRRHIESVDFDRRRKHKPRRIEADGKAVFVQKYRRLALVRFGQR